LATYWAAKKFYVLGKVAVSSVRSVADHVPGLDTIRRKSIQPELAPEFEVANPLEGNAVLFNVKILKRSA